MTMLMWTKTWVEEFEPRTTSQKRNEKIRQKKENNKDVGKQKEKDNTIIPINKKGKETQTPKV